MKKKVSIMQPYLFPYIGYFNLCYESDYFVFYDDVSYIKQGWINRNRILVNKVPYTFTVPVKNGSSFEQIKNVSAINFSKFKTKFLKQIEQSYCKSKFFDNGMNYVEEVMNFEGDNISKLAVRSVMTFFEKLGVEREFLTSSESFKSTVSLGRSERIIEITKSLDSAHYINQIGGSDLYDKKYFNDNGVKLLFINPQIKSYYQKGTDKFFPSLSIIDVIMNNSADDIILHLESYDKI